MRPLTATICFAHPEAERVGAAADFIRRTCLKSQPILSTGEDGPRVTAEIAATLGEGVRADLAALAVALIPTLADLAGEGGSLSATIRLEPEKPPESDERGSAGASGTGRGRRRPGRRRGRA